MMVLVEEKADEVTYDTPDGMIAYLLLSECEARLRTPFDKSLALQSCYAGQKRSA